MAKRALAPASVRPRGSYSPGWEVSGGRLIYVAGQIPADAEGRTVARGDIAGQTRQVFENIRAVLAEGGATMADVIKINIFSTDIRFRDTINKIRGEVFKPPYPASTQVGVDALADPDFLVEIEAVAFVSG